MFPLLDYFHPIISITCISVIGFNGVVIATLPNALRTFKIYCASISITSQLVLFLWQTVEIDPLGHVRVVEALQNFVQKCDIIK